MKAQAYCELYFKEVGEGKKEAVVLDTLFVGFKADAEKLVKFRNIPPASTAYCSVVRELGSKWAAMAKLINAKLGKPQVDPARYIREMKRQFPKLANHF